MLSSFVLASLASSAVVQAALLPRQATDGIRQINFGGQASRRFHPFERSFLPVSLADRHSPSPCSCSASRPPPPLPPLELSLSLLATRTPTPSNGYVFSRASFLYLPIPSFSSRFLLRSSDPSFLAVLLSLMYYRSSPPETTRVSV
jgi:hypothetical protein